MDFSRKTWILAASAVLIIAGTGLFFGLRYYYDRKAPDFMKEYTLYVYPDTEAGALAWKRGSSRGNMRYFRNILPRM